MASRSSASASSAGAASIVAHTLESGPGPPAHAQRRTFRHHVVKTASTSDDRYTVSDDTIAVDARSICLSFTAVYWELCVEPSK